MLTCLFKWLHCLSICLSIYLLGVARYMYLYRTVMVRTSRFGAWSLKVSAHWRSLHTESDIFACVFPFFRKENSNLIQIFYWQTKVSEAVCKWPRSLHTESENFRPSKKIGIWFDFLRFRIRSMHFDRKGWGIRKNGKTHVKISDSVCNDLESEIFFRNVHTLKNKYDLTLCQSRLHTASETFVRQKKKIGSDSFFCVFASVACILIGKEDEYEKNGKTACENFGLSVQWPLQRIQGIQPQSRRGRRSNATLFDNRQQKNSECHELRTWKQSLLDSDHVLILNASLT